MTIVILLQLIDLATTFYGKSLGAKEVNPILKKLTDIQFVAVKVGFIVFLVVVPLPDFVFVVIGILYVVVIYNNTKVIINERNRRS